jgi:hypothetical protein
VHLRNVSLVSQSLSPPSGRVRTVAALDIQEDDDDESKAPDEDGDDSTSPDFSGAYYDHDENSHFWSLKRF